jgi:formylmethanofuran dehydrogenase subunit B
LLERNEPDAALLVGVKPSDYLSKNHLKSLAGIPWIMVGNVDPKESVSAKVVIRTAPLATATTGTVYRMDDISLPLKAVISSPLASDEEVLAQLEFAILARLRAGLPAKSGELV